MRCLEALYLKTKYFSGIVPKSNEYKRLRLDLAKCGYDMEWCDGILEVLKTVRI